MKPADLADRLRSMADGIASAPQEARAAYPLSAQSRLDLLEECIEAYEREMRELAAEVERVPAPSEVAAETLTDEQIREEMARLQTEIDIWTDDDRSLYDDCITSMRTNRSDFVRRMCRERIADAINARGAKP